MNPLVARRFAHQGQCPRGSDPRVDPETGQTWCAPRGPRMVGMVLMPSPVAPSCTLGAFVHDKQEGALVAPGTSIGTLAGALGLGGAVAGFLLAGRPIAGALLGLGAGVGVGAYRLKAWRAAGGTSHTPGACNEKDFL